jgi:hypothetical protein
MSGRNTPVDETSSMITEAIWTPLLACATMLIFLTTKSCPAGRK